MKLAFAEEIKSIDLKAESEAFLPTCILMENAGRAIFDHAIEMLGSDFARKKVCILAGKGNNGGDAFVAARYLLNFGVQVKVFLLADEKELNQTAQGAYNTLKTMQPEIYQLTEEESWHKLLLYLLICDLLIDGILGSGFQGELEGSYARIAKIINESKKPVLAIDLPTGVNGDNGKVAGLAVQATQTVTLLLPKPGLFLFPGRLYAGRVAVVPLGVPNYLIDSASIKQQLITQDLVSSLLPKRFLQAHKSQAKAALVAGERQTTGAAALCSEAALRTGAGTVKLFTSQEVADLLAIKLTEVMVDGLAANEDGLVPDFLNVLEEKTADFAAIGLGPGLGTKKGTQELVCKFIAKTEKTLVLDADALNALVGKTSIFTQTKEVAVLTPHLGEMARLTSLSVEEILAEGLLRIARKYAIDWRAVLVLKGSPTLVALPDGQVFLNTTGNPGMATAGSGDVLTGTITGLIAQGLPGAQAAICGVYLHSLAGDLVAQNGLIGLAAGDLVAALPQARAQIAK